MLCDIRYFQALALYKYSYQGCFGGNVDTVSTLLEEIEKLQKLRFFLSTLLFRENQKMN